MVGWQRAGGRPGYLRGPLRLLPLLILGIVAPTTALGAAEADLRVRTEPDLTARSSPELGRISAMTNGSVITLQCTDSTNNGCTAGAWPYSVAPSNTYAWTSTIDSCPSNGTRVSTILAWGGWQPVTVDHGAVADGSFVATKSGSFTTPSSGVGSTGNPVGIMGTTHYVGRTSVGCHITISIAWVSGSTPWANNVGMTIEAAPAGTIDLENGTTSRDPVQTFSGAFLYSFTDVGIAGRGPTPVFRRSYNSADTRVGPMGPGWTHTYNARLRETGDATGDILFVRPDGNTDRFTRSGAVFTPQAATYADLVRNPNLTYTVTEHNQFRWGFDPAGNLKSVTDRYGNTSLFGYDGSMQLTSISDPAGRGSLTLAYTGGLLTSVTDWASPARTVTYQYDANGRLWKVTDRENKTTTFGYDGTSSRLTAITDARSNVAVTMTYDGQGRVQTQKDAQGLVTGATTSFGYVVNGDGTRVTTVTYPATSFEPSFSPTVVDTYSAQGWLTQQVSHPTSTETLTESLTYDSVGNPTSITDARGFTTNLCYDTDYTGTPIAASRGNLTRRIHSAPSDGANRPVTLFTYDAKNNPTQIVAPKGVPSGTMVTCATNLSSIDTAYATDMAYDAPGALLVSTTSRFTDPDTGLKTAITKFEYNDSTNPGRMTRVIPPRGNTGPSPDYTYASNLTYAASGPQAGMLIATADALGNTATYGYDAVGRLTSSVDALGNAAGGVPADHTTTFSYDKEDQVRFATAPAPQAGGTALTTEFRYDEVGNRTVQIDANGQVTTYAYDNRDGLFQVKESPLAWTDPANPPATVITTEYSYDAAGNLTRMTRAKGDATYERATDYIYEGRDLVRRETQYPAWPSTTPTLVTNSSYDPNGNPLTLVDPLGQTTTSSYDRLDRLTGIDYSSAGTPDVVYGYDANGNRTSMADGTGTTTYAYDEADRLTSVTSPGPKTVGYRYDLDGNRTKLIYPDSTAVTYTFNKASQLGSLLDWASRSVSYTYWPDGVLQSATNPDTSVATYTYDNARRLTDLQHQVGATSLGHYAYTLDAVGNVTALQDGASATYASVVLADSPVAYWRLGETSGSVANDEIGTLDGTYSATGVTLGQPGAITGDSNTAVLFNPAASGNVAVTANGTALDRGDGPLTLEAWVKKTNNNVDYGIVSRGVGGYYLRIASDNTINFLRSNTADIVHSTTTITDTNWHHVAATKNGSTVKLYIDGVDRTGTVTNSTLVNPSDTFHIGSDTGANEVIDGRVDEVAVYDHVLTPQAIAAHYAAGTGGGGGGLTYTYGLDRLYRLTTVSGPDGNRTYAYDPAGNRSSLTSGTTTTYNYDRADRITSLQGPSAPGSSTQFPSSNDGGWTTSNNGHASDNVFATTQPPKNQTRTVYYGTFGFDSTIPADATITNVTVTVEWKVSVTTSIATLGAQAWVNGAAYGTELVNPDEPISEITQSFSVTGLTRAQLLNGAFQVRIRATRGNQNPGFTASLDVVSVKVDYTAPTTISLTTNANGNLVAKGADTFAYDQANRLTSATVAGTSETYAYDGDGVRFSRTVGTGPAVRYVSDINTTLPVTIDDGTRKYVWGLGLSYAISGSTTEIYHVDRLGSIRAITDATGAVTATYRTDEYGVPTVSTGTSAQPFKYTGEPRDANGLSYFRARYYDPTLGRFMSRDLWPGIAGVPGSLNRFSYVGNNPIGAADPSGRQCDITAFPTYGECLLNGIGVAGAAASGAASQLAAAATSTVVTVGGFIVVVGLIVQSDTARPAAPSAAPVIWAAPIRDNWAKDDGWLRAQNNKQTRQRIRSAEEVIKEHERYLREHPDWREVKHWRGEIENQRRIIERLRGRLPGKQPGPGSRVLVDGKLWSDIWL